MNNNQVNLKKVIEIKKQYLTSSQRKEYLAELTQDQRNVLDKYKRYKFNSHLLTDINQAGTNWKLLEEEVCKDYDFHHQNLSPLVCECGKHVKYLYICQAQDTKQIKKFGRNHLAQEAGIPANIINQVNKLHHKIDRGTDIILSKYHEGGRFPRNLYNIAQSFNLIDNLEPREQKLLANFAKVNLPLYDQDMYILEDLTKSHKQEAQSRNNLLEQIQSLQSKFKSRNS